MVTQIKNRKATEDIDVSIMVPNAQMYALVLKAIASVARNQGIV